MVFNPGRLLIFEIKFWSIMSACEILIKNVIQNLQILISRHALRHHSESEKAWKNNFKDVTAERAKRLRFDGKKWSEDLIQIKMEGMPFNQGRNILSL